MCARGAGTHGDVFERTHGDVLSGHTAPTHHTAPRRHQNTTRRQRQRQREKIHFQCGGVWPFFVGVVIFWLIPFAPVSLAF